MKALSWRISALDKVLWNGMAVSDTKAKFEAGMMNGKGEYQWPDGTRYIGAFAQDRRSGLGILNYPDDSVPAIFMEAVTSWHGRRTAKGQTIVATALARRGPRGISVHYR